MLKSAPATELLQHFVSNLRFLRRPKLADTRGVEKFFEGDSERQPDRLLQVDAYEHNDEQRRACRQQSRTSGCYWRATFPLRIYLHRAPDNARDSFWLNRAVKTLRPPSRVASSSFSLES